MARIINLQLVENTDERRGEGKTSEDPIRIIYKLHSPDGDTLLEYDPHLDQTTMVANLLAHLGWIPKA